MRGWRALGWWVLGTVVLGIGALPGARVPIIGDDLQAYFEAYALAGGTAGGALSFGWAQGTKAGHFNPVGQSLGALYHYSSYAFSSATGLTPQLYDVAAGSALMWLTVLAGAVALRWGLRLTGAPLRPLGPIFALVATVTAATIQLHPWSNDPVTTYSMAGWGSAAIGFWVLGSALRAVVPGRRRAVDLVMVGVSGLVAVTYYEELVGMVAGAAAVLVVVGLRAFRRGRAREVRGTAVLFAVGVVLPAAVFLAGRLLAVPSAEANYSGTSIALGREGMQTWVAAMAGALPTASWPFLMIQAGRQLVVTIPSLVLGAVMLAAVAAFWTSWRARPVPPTGIPVLGALPFLAGVLVSWAATTATHAFTPKYIAEINYPGQVYLSYAVGLICVALLVAWAVVEHAPQLRSVAPVATLAIGAFIMLQFALNWQLGGLSADAYAVNRQLASSASDASVPPEQRCASLLAFAEQPWPDYYRDSVLTNAQLDFELAFDEELCPDPDVLSRLEDAAPES